MSLSQSFLAHIAQTSPAPIGIEVQRAAGIYLYGPNGERWIDFISGICVSNVGHAAKEVIAAIQAQSERYLHPMVYGEAIMRPQVLYAQQLVALLDQPLERVYFVNSGAEAIEGALKIARKYTARSKILSCWNAYHGSTYGALSVTGNPWMREGYGPFVPEVSHIHFNSFEDIAQIDQSVAAIVIEPIQGAGGVVLAQKGYLQAIRNRCDETGTLMILDEIQTGFGRTGTLFAHQSMEFVPDILVLAKALGGGLPLGAFISSREIMSVIQQNPPLGHLTTYGGHPLCCAAGLAAFNKILDEHLLDKISSLEHSLQTHLQHPAIGELRGMGLMYALILKDRQQAEKVRKSALAKGLLTIGFLSIDNGLRLTPPLTMTTEEMEMACGILVEAMEEL